MCKSQTLRIFVAALISAPACADLVSMDWLTQGDALITYDTNTGLYWLNTSYTSGSDRTIATQYTYSKIESRIHNNSDVLFGFRHATLAEVNTLFTNAGLLLIGDGYQSGAYATPTQTTRFVTLLGTTLQTTRRADVMGFTSANCSQVNDPQCPITTGNENFRVYASAGYDSLNRTYADLVAGYQIPDNYKINVGHFLVIEYFPTRH